MNNLELWLAESCGLCEELKDIIALGIDLIKNVNLSDEVVAKISGKNYETLRKVKE